ncbi:hypothetical protein SpCBS45565_g01766 [Spizellomyces sp. 'palustris']|nr:hypothetical protein SpCBS45565_g01766 [Spizellomyces sp. 'palustris']
MHYGQLPFHIYVTFAYNPENMYRKGMYAIDAEYRPLYFTAPEKQPGKWGSTVLVRKIVEYYDPGQGKSFLENLPPVKVTKPLYEVAYRGLLKSGWKFKNCQTTEKIEIAGINRKRTNPLFIPDVYGDFQLRDGSQWRLELFQQGLTRIKISLNNADGLTLVAEVRRSCPHRPPAWKFGYGDFILLRPELVPSQDVYDFFITVCLQIVDADVPHDLWRQLN